MDKKFYDNIKKFNKLIKKCEYVHNLSAQAMFILVNILPEAICEKTESESYDELHTKSISKLYKYKIIPLLLSKVLNIVNRDVLKDYNIDCKNNRYYVKLIKFKPIKLIKYRYSEWAVIFKKDESGIYSYYVTYHNDDADKQYLEDFISAIRNRISWGINELEKVDKYNKFAKRLNKDLIN